MNAVRALLARINSRLDEIEAGPAVAGVALFLTAALAALIFGSQTVLNVVFIAGVAVLFWHWGVLHSRADEALDRGDENKGQIEQVKEIVFGNDVGSGKHSKGRAA